MFNLDIMQKTKNKGQYNLLIALNLTFSNTFNSVETLDKHITKTIRDTDALNGLIRMFNPATNHHPTHKYVKSILKSDLKDIVLSQSDKTTRTTALISIENDSTGLADCLILLENQLNNLIKESILVEWCQISLTS
jgi:hypothetical protein